MRRIGRMLAAAGGCTAALLAFGAASASATTLEGCNGSGNVHVTTPGVPTWTVSGSGSCPVQLNLTAPIVAHEPTVVQFSGSGTSDSLGLCSGALLVTNFRLNVTVTVTGTVSGTSVVQNQVWYAPITTFPVATEFLISSSSGPSVLGAGVMFSHIFLQCGNSGNQPSANFAWAQSP